MGVGLESLRLQRSGGDRPPMARRCLYSVARTLVHIELCQRSDFPPWEMRENGEISQERTHVRHHRAACGSWGTRGRAIIREKTGYWHGEDVGDLTGNE